MAVLDQTQLGTIETHIEGGVAHIVFAHPAHNSLPGKLLADLHQSILDVGSNPKARVVILESAGDRTFCAGASFDELMAIENIEEGKAFFMGFARVINALRQIPQLVIGKVQGKAIGGGVGLASAVDYCLATQFAAIKLSELAIGIGPFVVGPAVARKVGVSAMSQLAIAANEWRSAEWAKAHGLYAEIYETKIELDVAVLDLAKNLSEYHPAAMQALKKTFWLGTENWDELLSERAAISGELVLSDFTKTAIQSFKKK